MKHRFHKSILRAYDIRGIIGETLNANDAYVLGFKFSCYVRKKNISPKIAVGFDGRLSSELLNKQVIKGLVDAGSDVTSIGLCPSPVLYFASKVFNSDGAIMITGSHNPANYNGFKMLMRGKSLYGNDIQKLALQSDNGLKVKGSIKKYNIHESYINEILKDVKNINNKLKVVWDAGNGATGEILQKIIKFLPGKHYLLNSKIDGTFPAHHPDPTVEKNLEQLKDKVSEVNADIGISFDGDGDRIGIINYQKKFITGDKLLYIYATDVVKKNPGAIIISDVKASDLVFSQIKKIGGSPLMWKTGHSFIKEKMKKTGALLAGEMSGHVFFADKYFGYDDALYAAIRILNILSEKKIINKLLEPFSNLVSTPEIKITCDDKLKFEVLKKCKNLIKKEYLNVNFIDGIRVNKPEGWWLLRASNTQPALIVRCEAKDKKKLNLLILEVKKLLEKIGIKNNL